MNNRNTFVFGIGGTGARVIRSLTMLLASGARLAHAGKIIPIIVDVDAENEDTARTVKALDLYKKIRAEAWGEGTDNVEGFFGAHLNTLSSQKATETEGIRDEFQMKFAGIASTFGEYLRVADMEAIDAEFLDALYDSSPRNSPAAELNLELTKGFKGNPNIGCIVFNELENSPEFKYFQNAIGEDDRIFVVSSIFGGTGSAGFPQLLKLIKASRNARVSSARIGAITVMPYFAVQEESESAIDSARFMSKTKAALSYYEKEMEGLDAMYYIYDKAGSLPYENHEGGREQRNDAHLVELLSAASIIHFTNKDEKTFEPTTQYHEFGIKRNDPVVDISHFFEETQAAIFKPLTEFTYAAKAHLEYVPNKSGETFAKELNLASELRTNAFYQNLTAFLKDHYWAWLQELERNSRGFKPFNLRENFNSMVTGKQIDTGIFEKGISDGFLDKEFGKIEHDLKKSMPKGERRYLTLLHRVSLRAMEKLGKLPAIA